MRIGIALIAVFFGLLGSLNFLRGDGFLYSNGVFTPIQVPGTSPGAVTPRSINDAGQIVGSVFINGERGFLDSGGAFTILNAPNGNYGTDALGINNAGEIVGSATQGFPSYIQTHGFLYANENYSTIDFPA